MLEHRDLETPTHQAISARSSLSLTWRLDPATGKPVARWVLQRPQPSASGALREAA
jgi:hypothetical protein